MSSAFPQILVMGLFVVGLALFVLWLDFKQKPEQPGDKKN